MLELTYLIIICHLIRRYIFGKDEHSSFFNIKIIKKSSVDGFFFDGVTIRYSSSTNSIVVIPKNILLFCTIYTTIQLGLPVLCITTGPTGLYRPAGLYRSYRDISALQGYTGPTGIYRSYRDIQVLQGYTGPTGAGWP